MEKIINIIKTKKFLLLYPAGILFSLISEDGISLVLCLLLVVSPYIALSVNEVTNVKKYNLVQNFYLSLALLIANVTQIYVSFEFEIGYWFFFAVISLIASLICCVFRWSALYYCAGLKDNDDVFDTWNGN